MTRSLQAMRDIGVVRVNAFPNATTRAPKLDVELFYWFGKINVYINLVPRANLVSTASSTAHAFASACADSLVHAALHASFANASKQDRLYTRMAQGQGG